MSASVAKKWMYVQTHPWITFEMDLRSLQPKSWMQLGEIISKAKHVANAPIDPHNAKRMYNVFLAKGAAATTAIEGNTLPEEDVLKQIEGKLELPESQEYLQIETQNIIDACNQLVKDLEASDFAECKVTVAFIEKLNANALNGLELEDGVLPGKIRQHSVAVGGYRGPPADECYYLLERTCNFIEDTLRELSEEDRYIKAIFVAVFAHVYIALIHPFGDGNGRTSRLLEVYILLRAGFPMPTCQLLSNHYNKTRTAYYRNLDAISKKINGGLNDFVAYALQGFVDGIREQVEEIQREQVRVTWVNYVHTEFAEKTSEAAKRQRNLALAISRHTDFHSVDDVLAGDLKLGREYAQKDPKTLTRDLNILIRMDLIVRGSRRRFRPNTAKITSFLPWRHDISNVDE